MLAIERAGEGICGLWGIAKVPPGERIEAAGEYGELGTGEPRSEIVWQPTADGVALEC